MHWRGQVGALVLPLADGRAGGFVVTTGPFLGSDTGYLLFRKEGGRWLVDAIIEFL